MDESLKSGRLPADTNYMDVIPPPRASTDRGLRALGRDLWAFDGQEADPRARRPVVVRRLLAAGAPPALLDGVLPDWADYLDDSSAATAGSPSRALG